MTNVLPFYKNPKARNRWFISYKTDEQIERLEFAFFETALMCAVYLKKQDRLIGFLDLKTGKTIRL